MTGRSKNAGFSLAELIGVVVIIGILAGGATIMISNATKESNSKIKMNNAAEATRMVQNIRSAGGDVATDPPGFKSTMDTAADGTAETAVITALQNGVTAGGITFKLGAGMTPENYNLVGAGWNAVIKDNQDLPTP